nr:hypothetical protein [Metasolibacillus meyeri]
MKIECGIEEGQEWVIDMINNIIIEVYTSMAEQEPITIKQHQAEGIAVAILETVNKYC